MRSILIIPHLIVLALCAESISSNETVTKVYMQMSGYSPTKVDNYVAISQSADPGYIIGFTPLANSERVHHIVIYGCEKPAEEANHWKGKETCGNGISRILYAWGRDAPALNLPEDVGFSVGHSNDSIRFLVMQVHYAHPFIGKVKDYSGVILHVSRDPTPKLAGIYVFASSETIPPKKEIHLSNISCFYRGSTPIHAFAYRAHTHSLGRMVSGYIKSDGNWTRIGGMDPRWPESFSRTTAAKTITKGDLMVVTCRFDSHDKDKPTRIGNIEMEEMCNFYMMYYWEAGQEHPFTEGYMCAEQEGKQLVQDFPEEGIKLPKTGYHQEMRAEGLNESASFGVQDLYSLNRIGSITLGQIGGLSFDHDTNLIIFHRGDRVWNDGAFDEKNALVDRTPIASDTVLFVRFGGDEPKAIRTMGANQFFMPHGISYGADEFLFTTDAGSHTVAKWKIENDKLVLVWELGERFVPGSDDNHFCQPTAVLRAGNNIYVADGGCNDRMLEFNLDGKKMNEYGSKPEMYLRRPHDLVATNRLGLILADAGHRRTLQVTTIGDIVESFSAGPFPNFTSAHDHGDYIYTVAGEKTRAGEDIEVYAGRKNSPVFEFSFMPEGKPLVNPHILRLNQGGELLFIGDNGEEKGTLRVFRILSKGAKPTPTPKISKGTASGSFNPSSHPLLSFISYFCVVFLIIAMILLTIIPLFLIVWKCYLKIRKRKSRFTSFPRMSDTEKFIGNFSDEE